MIDRVKHNAGFTLAELLLSIAIIMVLAAIAIPSIVTAQNNMRMVELNNAAQSIANAAQTQMTAMKVSGTWLALVEDADGKVQYPASSTSADTDTYYMVADSSGTLKGARDNGVVPGLSIDDTVRRGDFVIVFKASTASVVEVFYADGKTGFFGEAPESTNAAQSYYADGSGNTAQAARMANDPMIGYYQGTPAGATDAVALENPVIWVNEETGRLMMQDPNISEDGTTGDTTSTIVVVNKTEGVQFVLSSLSKGTTLMYVGLKVNDETDSGKTDDFSLSGIELKDVVEQVNRAGAGGGNVFAIDLNALSRKVTQTSSKAPDALKEAFNACKSDDDLDVRVTTTDTTRACVPAQASAHIKWPAPVGKLTLMVTNPYSAVVAASGDKDGGYVSADSYKEPTVRATADDRDDAKNGVISTSESEDVQNNLRDTFANTRIAQENKQSAYQSYAGGWVASSDVRDDETFRLEANVGSYGAHTYQIWELWIKRSDNGEAMRVGYLRNNAWEWAVFEQDGQKYDYEFLNQCLTWYAADGSKYDSITGVDTDATNIVAVAVNAQKLFASINDHADQHVVDEDGNASIYVRTAPKMSEVNTYFNSLAESDSLITNFLSAEYDETSSRSAYSSSGSPTARKAFEGEFGASSSDVSWVVSRDRKTGFEQGDAFLGDETYTDVRVYYSISPGVGFANIRTYELNSAESYLTNVRSTSMTNVSLWLYRGLASQTLEAMTPAILWQYDDTRYTCRQNGERYDFKLTTLEDYRFYRVLMYYDTDKDGKVADKLDIPDQYAPHVAADKVVISGANNKDIDSETVDVFKEWLTDEGVVYQSGDSLALHVDQLKSQGTRLLAQYTPQKKSVGLMYLEFTDGAVSGYYGYLGDGDNNSIMGALPDDNAITDWGYFVVVPTGAARPTNETFGTDTTIVPLDIGGLKYDAYKITKITESSKVVNQTQTWTSSNEAWTKSATFTVNFNFAASIVKGADANGTLGKADAPYGVRTGVQFPLALKANGTPSIQPNYMASSFQQMHSIDLTGLLSTDYAYRPNNVFSGTYDGGKGKGFVIKGLSSRFIGEFNHRQGLFPMIQSAELRNIAVRVENDITIKWNPGVDAAFGCLAGVAVDSTIKDCSVAPLLDNSIATITLAELKPQGGKYQDNEGNNIGGLVGYAKNTSIDSSSVSNISLNVQSSDGTWKTDSIRLGLVIGKLDAVKGVDEEAAVYDGLTAKSVTLVDGGTSTTNTQSLGGIVGQLVVPDGGTVSASKWNVDTCVLEKPALGKRSLLLAGGFIGARIGTVTFANCSCSGMVLKKPDGKQETLDTVLVGTDAIEDNAPGDTDVPEDNEPVDADVIESGNSEKQL